jgi:hypothetical protein
MKPRMRACRGSVKYLRQEVMLATTILVTGLGVGSLSPVAHAEVCPNASSRSGPSASLPDCRAYEMVSPVANEDGDVYVPETGSAGDAIATARPFRASADGDAVAYVGDPSAEGNGAIGFSVGNSYLATRPSAGGWTARDVQPPGVTYATYQAFSSDLSLGILDSPEALPEAGVPEELDGYDLLYSRTSGGSAYHPLFTTRPPNRLPTKPGEGGGLGDFGSGAGAGSQKIDPVLFAGANAGTSTVPSFSHILFEANDALTGNAVDPGEEANNLYDSIGGQLRLVNVLPSDATEPNKSATFGAPRDEDTSDPPDFSHDISADGSRIFWSSLNSAGGLEDLYVRENGTETVLISEGGRFWTANSEGTEAFFTKGDLYEWHEVDGVPTTTDLTPGVEVQGVLGASENGEYVYYVDTSDNLDLWHEGVVTFIATLAPGDNNTQVIASNGAESGDWRPGLAQRSAQVTPDGRAVVFMSSQSLTGYPNEGLREVYVYEDETGRLFCASCYPGGAPPVLTGYKGNAGFLPLPFGGGVRSMNTYQPRWINEEGSRVFFDGEEPLVAQDTNGQQDVYEWERDGAGSCQAAEGCVYLLSGGTSSDISAFVDASSSGNDAFIVTRAQLVPQDRNEDDDLYDIRVDGVQSLVPPACTGTGCQGVPSAPPLFATPPSVTFNGVGNLEPLPPVSAVKPKVKPLTRAQELAKALKACKTKPKKKRAACKTQAKKSYGAKSKAKKSAKARK